MTDARILRFYLDDGLRQSAGAGQHNFIALVSRVAEAAGYRIEYRRNSEAERQKSATRGGYSMFHMDDPFHDRALSMRRVYHYPFWAIEPSARRWEWYVARTRFDPTDVARKDADRFYRFWRKRLFGNAPTRAGTAGFVYVPLQGRLLDRRSFQSCSPLDMIHHTLRQEPNLPLVVTLHPGEEYTPRERQALNDLRRENTRIRIESGQMERWLEGCNYVVTENSSVAFSGFFFGKPAVLFAQIDFHHIAANVDALGVKGAFDHVREATPDHAGYIHWFWQKMSINAGRSEAADRIRTSLTRAGWPT